LVGESVQYLYRGAFCSIFLIGCGNDKDPNSEPITSVIDDTQAVDLLIGPAAGFDEVYVPVRGVNSYNVALPNIDASLEFTGTGVNNNGTEIQTGVWGVAEVRLWSSTAQHIQISAVGWDAENTPTGDAWLLAEDWQPQSVSMAHSLAGKASHIAGARQATTYSVGSEIYWQGHESGKSALHSASLTGDVLGLLALDMDGDGHSDAIAWSENEILLLRGGALGLIWGAGFTMSEGSIVDVAADFVDNDNFPDVAIAYTNGSQPGVQLLLNDGAWGFEESPRLPLGGDPESISIGSYLGNGNNEVAILEDGNIARYRYEREEARWLNSGQDLRPEPGFGIGSQLGTSEDISGDGADELILAEPAIDSGERRLAFYELTHERPLIYDLQFEANEYVLGDATGDGIAEILVLQNNETNRGELRALTAHEAGEDPYRNRSFSTLAQVGAMGMSDEDGDGIQDLTVTKEAILHYKGRIPEIGYWAVADPGIGGWDMSSTGHAILIDANKDGKKKDLLVIRDVSSETALWSYTFSGGANGAELNLVKNPTYKRSLDNRNGADRATFLDWDLCEQDGMFIYMLVDDGGGWLYVTKIQSNGSVPGRADVALRADKVTCGNFANGARVAAVSYAGEVNYFDDALNPVATDNIGPMDDVIAVNLDGNGDVLYSCTGNCSLAAADTDGDGIDELVQGGDNAFFSGWGKEIPLGTSAQPSFSDVDGNGTLDLVLTSADSGHFQIHPVFPGSLSVGQAWHTRQAIQGNALGGDVDADGRAEFFLMSNAGDLLFASQD